MEQWGLTLRRQGARLTCSTFTLTTALEFAAATKQGRGPRLSVAFLNWTSNAVLGQLENGGFFSGLCNGFTKHGLCAEDQMPYRVGFEQSSPPLTGVRPRGQPISPARHAATARGQAVSRAVPQIQAY